MRIGLVAIGKLKAGPEQQLSDRYVDRIRKTGPAIGIEFSKIVEGVESRASSAEARKREEAQFIEKALPEAGLVVLLDERGKALDSPGFADLVGGWRDSGRRDLTVVIGGPDGLDPALHARADVVLCLGKMTWPHQIVRILVAEQLYRAITILSGHPYHRV